MLFEKKNLENYLVLFPYDPNTDINLKAKEFASSFWRMNFKNDHLNSLQLHFLTGDSITGIFNYDKISWITSGKWQLLNSGPYYLLSFKATHFKEYNFYILDKKQDEIAANIGMNNWSEYPYFLNTKMIRNDFPKEAEWEEIKDLLYGKWIKETREKDILEDDSLSIKVYHPEIEEFTIEFLKDGKFNSSIETTLFKENDTIRYSNEWEGKWELSETGNYISLITGDNLSSNAIIKFRTEVKLELGVNLMVNENRSSYEYFMLKKDGL